MMLGRKQEDDDDDDDDDDEEDEPPKTILVSFKPPSTSNMKRQQRRQSQQYDYMQQSPSSMAKPLQPIFPWEEQQQEDTCGTSIRGQTSTTAARTTATSSSNGITSHAHSTTTCYTTTTTTTTAALAHDNNRNRHLYQYQQQQQTRHYQNLLILALLFVTLALAAGSAGEGQAASNATAGKKKKENRGGKQRGHHLPGAKTREKEDDLGGGIARNMYEVYTAMKEEYHSKTFAENNNNNNNNNKNQWKVLNERDGAKVSVLEHASDPTCPYVRMETIIPTSVQACWEFLSIHNWNTSMPKMDPFYDNHRVVSNYTEQGVNMILVQKRTHRILAFGKRDFVFLSVTDLPLEDGTYVSGSVSVETPDVPRSAGYTRAFQDSIAFYKPMMVTQENGATEKEEHCHLTIVCRIDLNDSGENGSGGFMPMWLYVKTVGATGLKSVLKMKHALMEMKTEQRQQQQQQQQQQANKDDDDDDDDVEESSSASVAQAPTAAFPTPTATHPTPSKVVSPPTITAMNQHSKTQPMSIASTGKDEQEQKAPTTFKWWHRGGAFVTSAAAAAKKELPAAAEAAATMSPLQPWKPLFEVFSHIPPKEGPQPMPTRNTTTHWGLGVGGVKWLKRIQVLGNFKQWKL